MNPTGWEEVSIENICESIVDCLNRTAPSVGEVTPYKMIRTTNVRDGWINLSDVKYVDQSTYEKWTRRQVPQKGDVILTREAPLGEVGMIRGNDKMFLGQRLVSYRVDPDKADNKFVLYAFQAHHLQSQIKALGSGSTVEHMRVPDAKKLRVLLPPLPAQRRIASILSAYDDLIENNTRRIAVLEEMARRLYEEWFVKFRFPGHEEIGFEGGVPEGWEMKRLGELVHDVRDSVHPSQVPEDTPYVGLEHIPRRSITLREWSTADTVGSNKLRFQRGDILFGKIRPYFHKVCVAPMGGICSSDTIVLRPVDEGGFPVALCCSSSDAFVDHATQTSNGTKMPRANWKVLQDYPVAVPPDELLGVFNRVIRDVVAQTRSLMLKNANLRAQRDLLLPKLISGQIDVSGVELPYSEEVAA